MSTIKWPVLALLILAFSATAAIAVDPIARETLATRSYFYVGGQYVVVRGPAIHHPIDN